MLYITQLIYINEGQEAAFHDFEDLAIPLIAAYGGELLLRTRGGEKIAGSREHPYEIHLVSFPSTAHFERFKHDETRKAFLHLKEQSVRVAMLIVGEKLG